MASPFWPRALPRLPNSLCCTPEEWLPYPPKVEETLGGTKYFGTKPPQLTQQAADGRSSGMSTKEVDRQGSSETMNNRAARTPPPQPLELPQCNRQISRCRFFAGKVKPRCAQEECESRNECGVKWQEARFRFFL